MAKYKSILVSGFFNIIHPGHIRLLRFAKSLCNRLVVCIYSDTFYSEGKVKISEDLRLENIKSLSFVDHAFITQKNIKEVIQELKPDAVVKGLEWKNQINDELEELTKIGGKLIFSSGESLINSSDYFNAERNLSIIKKPSDFIERNKIDLSTILQVLKKAKNLKVAVLGDLIIDRYIHCQAVGMSQEDSSLVYKPVSENTYLGGAGIVAAHAKSFVENVDFFTVIGKDEYAKVAKSLMKKYDLSENYLIVDDSRNTIVKNRYIQDKKSVFRLSEYQQFDLEKKLFNSLLNKLSRMIKKYDLIIISDFNYGFVTDELINFIKLEKSKNSIISADCQSSSQFGNILKFNSIDIIKPTEYEARSALLDNNSGLIELCNKISNKTDVKNIIMSLGGDGLVIYNNSSNNVSTEQINALNQQPLNISGAGDSLLVLLSIYFSLTKNTNESALLGSMAAAIQVSREGNIPIKYEDIVNLIKKWMH